MIHDIDKSSLDMIDWSCANCGCVQWMPKDLNEQLRKTHNTFYCVNGHGNIYSKKTNVEEIEGKLMNEYTKNAQLEHKIKVLQLAVNVMEEKANKSIFNKFFGNK